MWNSHNLDVVSLAKGEPLGNRVGLGGGLAQ